MIGAPPRSARVHIVIVGGGAGGLELARRLGRVAGRRLAVTLIDRNQTHIWKPLLHEVAAGALDANLDEVGYRSHCHRWGYHYFNGAMEGIDRAAREVVIAPLVDDHGIELIGRHRIAYDWLVIAIGSVTNDFATPGARANCVFLDDRAQADRFRSQLLNQCMRVSRAMSIDPASDHRVRVAIVGGGATGVELAAELYNSASALRYYGLEAFDEHRLQVTLIEAGPRILPALGERLAHAAQAELEKLGTRVLVATPVVEVTPDAMLTRTGERIAADLKVWAAGVRGVPMLDALDGLETNRTSQLVVTDTLQTSCDSHVFALGDCACFIPAGNGRPIPPRAQAAHQMAALVYTNLMRAIAEKPLQGFIYRDRGSLVSLSRFSTVGSLMGGLVGGALALEGRLARLAYTSLYRMHLLSIHGWLKGTAMIIVGHVNAIIRPKMKLH